MLYKSFKQDMIAFFGEFCGTTMFIFLGLGCIKTAQDAQTFTESQTVTSLSNTTIQFIAVGMGLSLLITAWVFYRITGGLFNPAVTLSLWMIGGIRTIRAILLVGAQIAGGIAGAGLIAILTPLGGVSNTITKLEAGVSKGQGLMLEAFLTAMLVFTVLMLAAEKHKATFMAPIGIGLTLFVCQMFGTLWTGCGMNPARSFGPSVISHSFPHEHWIYWVGPLIGSLIATGFYSILKAFDYGSVVLGQDSDEANVADSHSPIHSVWAHTMGKAVHHHHHNDGQNTNEKTQTQALSNAENGTGTGHVDSRTAPNNSTGDGLQRYASPGTVAHPGGRYPSKPSRVSDETVVEPSITSDGDKAAKKAKRDSSVVASQPRTASPTTMDASGQNGGAIAPNRLQALRQDSHSQMHSSGQDYGGIAPPGTHSPRAATPRRGDSYSQMHSSAQDHGGIAAPGTHSAGFGNSAAWKKAVR